MRSLWRMIAVRWLGGEASDALTGETTLLDLMMPGNADVPPAFLVRRQSEVSHRAMMSRHQRARPEDETALRSVVQTDRDASAE
jgi:hypothetical protein